MPTEDVAYQQRLKIRRTTLGFGVIQVILGLALTALSFTAFVLSESEKIRNACPYWAGFTVFCSGGVGIVAWRHSTVLSMGLFTFFSAVCVVLHMIGTILTGEVGGLLKSIILCQQNTISGSCMCCDTIMTCKQNVPSFKFEGVEECSILTGLLKELLYGLCVLNIFGSLVCFIATILGCTSVARQAGRDQPLFRRRLSAPSDSHEQSQYSWLHYPTDINMLPPYAPPIYRSVDNFQDCGSTPYVVPPPVFDPTDLPPPYSSRNASLSSSGFSLYVHSEECSGLGRSQPDRNSRGREGRSSIVIQEVISSNSENQFQQRIYSENRGRPGNAVRITSAVLTRNGVLEFRSNGSSNHGDRTADQSLNSSRASLQSEARRPLDFIGQRIEGIAQRFETHVLQRYEKAEECIEVDESVEKLDPIQDQGITSQNDKWRYNCKQNTSGIQRHLRNLDQSTEIITFENRHDFNKRNSSNNANNINNNLMPKGKMDRDIVGERQVNSSSTIEEEPSSNSNSDSGLGDDLSPLCGSVDLNSDYKDSNLVNITCIDSRNGGYVDTEKCHNQRDCDERSRLGVSATNPGINSHGEENSYNATMQVCNMSTTVSEEKLVSHDQTNSEQSLLDGAACNNECGTSNRLYESSMDNDFEGVPWNVFRKSNGFEPLIPLSSNDSEILQQVPMLAKLCETPGSTYQDFKELSLLEECENCESQELIPSEKMMPSDASHHQLMPSDASHHQLMPSDASHHQLMPSDASHHQLMPSDASHHQLMPSDASHNQLMPSDASHHQLMPTNASYQLMPSDPSHHQLMPTNASYQLMPSDASHQLMPSDSSHQLMPSDASHHQLMPNDASHHQLMPSDSSHHKLMPSDSSHHQLMPSNTSHHQLMPSNTSHQLFLNAKQQNKLVASNEDHELFPSNVNHHQLIPLDESHQELPSNNARQDERLQLDATHHQSVHSDREHHQLIPDDAASQQHLQPDYNTMTENCALDQETSVTGLLLSIDDQSDWNYPCNGFTALVSEVSGRHGLENAAGISLMGYSILDNERSAECHKYEFSESVLELESFRGKHRNNKDFAAEKPYEGLVKKGESYVGKTGQETFPLRRNNATLDCPGKQETCHSEDEGIPSASKNRKGDETEEVIRLMDDFKSSNNVGQILSDGLPVAQEDASLEGWEQLRLQLEQQTTSSTPPREDSNQLQSSMSSGRSSVDHTFNQPPDEIPCNSLATNFAETLSDSGSEHEKQIAVNNKPLARSDTCIAMETNYLVPREKIRTCSDPEVKGLGINGAEFRNHKKSRNRGRLLYVDCIGMAPPNIELPIEIISQGLGYCPDESKIQNWNTRNGEQRGKRRTAGSANDLVKNKPKAQSCHHRNRESTRRNKDELLKKEKALMKSIKLRNEMSRSFLHLHREKKPSKKDSENLWSPGSEFSRNALKKRKLVQKVGGDQGNSRFVSSVEYLKKAGHHNHPTKEAAAAAGQGSAGKETFV